MTHPTHKELAERLRNVKRDILCSHNVILDIAAALDAMPEGKEAVKCKCMDAVHRALSYAWGKDLNNDEQVRWQQFAQLWQSVMGFPWIPNRQPTPPQPERVTDEELDELETWASVHPNTSVDATIRRLVEAERARRREKGK